MTDSQPAFDPAFWSWYRDLNVQVLAPALTETEEATMRRSTVALEHCLGLEPALATRHARRGVLFHRINMLHEALMMELDTTRTARLVDTVIAVQGLEHLRAVQEGSGALLLSVHYSLYSSLLMGWLMRATHNELVRKICFVFVPASAPVKMRGRVDQFGPEGIARPGAIELLYLGPQGQVEVTRQILARLRAGAVVLMFSDAVWFPASHPKAMQLSLGRLQVGVPRGLAWLAEQARCAVLPVHIRPAGTTDTERPASYVLEFGRPTVPDVKGSAAAIVQATVQHLLDRTALADPGPWDPWPWIPDVLYAASMGS